MKNIFLFSLFLLIGLGLSQFAPLVMNGSGFYTHAINILTTIALGFIMIRVGYDFHVNKSKVREYAWDYVVAAVAATLPWLLVAIYFVYMLADTASIDVWKESLLAARFASPTSAGVLLSMLAAAGLAVTWVYRKIKILVILDDLDTILLMVVLKALFIGWQWQLGVTIVPMLLLLWAAWHYLHRFHLPITWPWLIAYSTVITMVSEAIYLTSKFIDADVPIHIEILLPAFVLGCMMDRSRKPVHSPDGEDIQVDIIKLPAQQRMSFIVSLIFMLLVGLSMPAMDIFGTGEGGSSIQWDRIALHVLFITLLANLGKMFPLVCYRKEAHWKERLALAIGMFPRGEVGAGVLIISISYGIGGEMIIVAMLSLALNLLLTGLFIFAVRELLISAHKIGGPKMLRNGN